MKLPELIQNIKSTLYNNRVPNSNLLDNRQIIYWINEMRALWLKREYDKVRTPYQNEKQILLEIDMIPYDTELINGKSLLISKNKLPRNIHWNTSDGITRVSGLDVMSEKINHTDRESAIYKGNGKFNRKLLFSFKNDDHLWITYGSNADKSRIPSKLKIEGIFENPLEIDEFNGTTGILTGDSEYPVSESFLLFIETEVFKAHIQRFIKDINSDDEEEIRQGNNKA